MISFFFLLQLQKKEQRSGKRKLYFSASPPSPLPLVLHCNASRERPSDSIGPRAEWDAALCQSRDCTAFSRTASFTHRPATPDRTVTAVDASQLHSTTTAATTAKRLQLPHRFSLESCNRPTSYYCFSYSC